MPAAMFFQIQTNNGVPVYEQIARQVKYAVADAALAPGDMIPSVRELSRELAVNPNTVSRAYRELKRDGVLETVSGAGMAVCTGARRLCQQQRRNLVGQRLSDALQEALQAGLETRQIEEMVASQLKRIAREHHRTGDSQ